MNEKNSTFKNDLQLLLIATRLTTLVLTEQYTLAKKIAREFEDLLVANMEGGTR